MGILQDDVAGDIGSVPRCEKCGSERVVKDACACWNPDSGLWELENIYNDAHCHQCEGQTKLVWSKQEHPPHQRIRELNDQFRRDGIGRGSIMLTLGIQENGGEFAVAAVRAVREFDDFSDDNDPWGEHDFGAIKVNGQKVLFKIDYLDPSLEKVSENPANEGCTHRVLTIMLGSEY
ncbi:DUF3768 domain-containing protein [Roseovarius rhodophyticola]|uniref:DUF3768 domain-containing protein n=1 Tax=Roseovarius rhodophyticola TaxID=3080827 RepID=A0ABZ2TJC4_9RHOB|nr:DUF3768 domain-containing protein [Roseovarius sp. W115]MDV2930171.1 DUF3768 domain-containing protein [Roseovarius sp. W115]